ncbi:peroxidase domain-containing protein [Phthorimaea operculella]|nr:peroxidase domain-containing protein [Phthorimaea operculella]
MIITLNSGWSSDKLYHEARKIVVAELQHITYKQWLPALTGKAFEELYDSYDTGYNSDVDPTITNAFATAAFHFVNSLLDQDIELVDETVTSERLKNHYYKPEIVAKKGGLKKLLKGMVNQKMQALDLNYDDDLRHHWLGSLDVLAYDIQRGRDHGLPGYTQYRTLCGLPQATSFQHLSDVIPQEMVDKLSALYENPSDIDLVVGVMAETPLPGSLLGPTATCFLKEQLWRTRVGDRYFYTHTDEAGSFSKRQLAEIKKSSLARLLCDNAGVRAVQRDVFQPPSERSKMAEIKKSSLARLLCDNAGVRAVQRDVFQPPSESYFYTHIDKGFSFSKRQLAEIKKSSLARLLCDNAGVRAVQRDVFQPPSESYFYTHIDKGFSFSKRQLAEIKKSSLARLLCDNAGVRAVQRDVFQPPSERYCLYYTCERLRSRSPLSLVCSATTRECERCREMSSSLLLKAGSFSKRQLAEIKKSSFARLLCDNAGVGAVQRMSSSLLLKGIAYITLKNDRYFKPAASASGNWLRSRSPLSLVCYATTRGWEQCREMSSSLLLKGIAYITLKNDRYFKPAASASGNWLRSRSPLSLVCYATTRGWEQCREMSSSLLLKGIILVPFEARSKTAEIKKSSLARLLCDNAGVRAVQRDFFQPPSERYYFYSSFEARSKMAEIKKSSLARLLCDNAGVRAVQRDVFQPPSERSKMAEIKKSSLARLLCDNAGVGAVQRDVFQPPSERYCLYYTIASDSYFYTHTDEAGSFSKRQLAEIKKSSLARLLCDNAGVGAVQRDVFQPPSESNPVVSCDEIKKVNLESFQDPAQQPDILTRTNKWLKTKVSSTGNSTK